VSIEAFHAAGHAHAYPEAGPAWQVAKLYAIAHIDDGEWEALRPGPETATVALDVRAYSEIQRQALLAHRIQIPPDSLWARLPDDLYRRAFATAYFIRLQPPAVPGEHESDLLDGLDVRVETACSGRAEGT
jgi:hypothetical protein